MAASLHVPSVGDRYERTGEASTTSAISLVLTLISSLSLCSDIVPGYCCMGREASEICAAGRFGSCFGCCFIVRVHPSAPGDGVSHRRRVHDWLHPHLFFPAWSKARKTHQWKVCAARRPVEGLATVRAHNHAITVRESHAGSLHKRWVHATHEPLAVHGVHSSSVACRQLPSASCTASTADTACRCVLCACSTHPHPRSNARPPPARRHPPTNRMSRPSSPASSVQTGGLPANFGGISISALVMEPRRRVECTRVRFQAGSAPASGQMEPPPQKGSYAGGRLPSVLRKMGARAAASAPWLVGVLPLTG